MKWTKYFSALFKGKKVIEEAIEQGQITKEALSKSSWKSSEFWFAMVAGLGAVAAEAGGILPSPAGPVILGASTFFYAISRGLAKHADPLGGLKPGFTTTEFWANLLSAGAALATAAAGMTSPEIAASLIGAAAIATNVSRGLAKGGAQPDTIPYPTLH